eukprot:5149404-Prymnesium_polylepis.1
MGAIAARATAMQWDGERAALSERSMASLLIQRADRATEASAAAAAVARVEVRSHCSFRLFRRTRASVRRTFRETNPSEEGSRQVKLRSLLRQFDTAPVGLRQKPPRTP